MIDIIIPVYNGFEDTTCCVESVLSCLKGLLVDVIIIDDATPDIRIKDYLEKILPVSDRITVVRNETNLGFIKSVNIGMTMHPDRDVILLNSDTIVASNWIERLYECAYRSDDIGTVTPFSNNATICSFPEYLTENNMVYGMTVETLDHIFKKANSQMDIDIPTAVGFCMYIKRACLNETGCFDERNFGTGYGEENDFCMRAMKKGWRHKLCADTFVYHKGGVSFDIMKTKRIENAMAVIDRLHPDYHKMIRDHISNDPGKPYRINAMIHILRESRKQKVLFINHNLGGGTEKHIKELSTHLKDQIWPLILRPSSNGRTMICFGCETNTERLSFSLPEDYEALLTILKYLNVGRIHIHQILGIHDSIFQLSNDLAIPYDITLHDYYLINGNPTLIDKNALFCDNLETRDEKCGVAYPVPGNLSLDAWRKKQKKLLMGAARVFSPSGSTAAIFKDYFPDLKPVVAFHPDWEKSYPYPGLKINGLKDAEPFRVLVLGALSREKGADNLEACAQTARHRQCNIEFHLSGYAYRKLNHRVIQHGAYLDDDLPAIIKSINPHLIWFPATWPETYSYTLSVSLNASLPIMAPNIGAFPERLKNRPLTWIADWKTSPQAWIDLILSIRQFLLENEFSKKQLEWVEQPQSPTFGFSYSDGYVSSSDLCEIKDTMGLSIDLIRNHLALPGQNDSQSPDLPLKTRLLKFLLTLRNHTVFGWFINKIPYRLQQMVKRRIAPVGDPLSSVIIKEQFEQSVKK